MHLKRRESHCKHLKKKPGASDCAEKLLDEAALSVEAKAELNRFMVANPTKKPLRFLPIVRELDEFVLSGESATPSLGLDGMCLREIETRLGEVLEHRHAISHSFESRTREAQR